SRSTRVRDPLGHGTFVASLATGSVTNGTGISGFGGDAQLLVVQAIDADGDITDVDEAAAIVYAVKHGAKIINLSIGGAEPAEGERRVVRWAARRRVSFSGLAARDALGRPARRPDRRGRGERARRGQPARLPGRAAAAAPLLTARRDGGGGTRALGCE